ncbi:MAG: DUF2125 domain-containing protein [Roseibium sp.]
MTTEPTLPQVSSKKRYIVLLAVIGLVIVGWSGAWTYGRSMLADQLDLQMARITGNGLELGCADLRIAGYPFRYEIRCTDLTSKDRFGAEGNLGSLNAVTLVYNPWHVILEADAPAAIAVPVNGLSGDISWDTARASVKYSMDGLGDLDMVLTKPKAAFQNSFSAAAASSEKAELHLRKAPDLPDGVDGFVSVDDLKLENVPELNDLLNLRVHLRLENGAPLLSGANLALLTQMNDGQLPIQLVFSEIKSGHSRFGASGDLVLDGNGLLSGQVKLSLSNPEQALAMIKPLFPSQDNGSSVAEGLFKSLKPTATDPDGNPAIELPLVIDQGMMRIGFVTLGWIPPLFQAGI